MVLSGPPPSFGADRGYTCFNRVKESLTQRSLSCHAGGIPVASYECVYGTLSGLLAKVKVIQKRRRR